MTAEPNEEMVEVTIELTAEETRALIALLADSPDFTAERFATLEYQINSAFDGFDE